VWADFIYFCFRDACWQVINPKWFWHLFPISNWIRLQNLPFIADTLVMTQLSYRFDSFNWQVGIKIFAVLNCANIRIVCCWAWVILSCSLFLFVSNKKMGGFFVSAGRKGLKLVSWIFAFVYDVRRFHDSGFQKLTDIVVLFCLDPWLGGIRPKHSCWRVSLNLLRIVLARRCVELRLKEEVLVLPQIRDISW